MEVEIGGFRYGTSLIVAMASCKEEAEPPKPVHCKKSKTRCPACQHYGVLVANSTTESGGRQRRRTGRGCSDSFTLDSTTSSLPIEHLGVGSYLPRAWNSCSSRQASCTTAVSSPHGRICSYGRRICQASFILHTEEPNHTAFSCCSS